VIRNALSEVNQSTLLILEQELPNSVGWSAVWRPPLLEDEQEAVRETRRDCSRRDALI
jgi:hypothetical protein